MRISNQICNEIFYLLSFLTLVFAAVWKKHLGHFMPLVSFYIPWKQKTKAFLTEMKPIRVFKNLFILCIAPINFKEKCLHSYFWNKFFILTNFSCSALFPNTSFSEGKMKWKRENEKFFLNKVWFWLFIYFLFKIWL